MSTTLIGESFPANCNPYDEQAPRDLTDHGVKIGETLLNGLIGGHEAQSKQQLETVETLLDRYEKPTSDGWLVRFHNLPEGVTAYNASEIFEVGEVPHLLVRVEGKGADKEFTSRLAIYQCSKDGRDCYPSGISNLEELTNGRISQDPSHSYVKGKHVITWVDVSLNEREEPSWKSVAAIGDSLDDLKIFVETEDDTKGLRFAELL
ncbi:MAG: hypothetical protein ACREF7_00550, partial [Candidatus Saccharimonadales bacterium]